jgi:flavin-dependent dehydrogenase
MSDQPILIVGAGISGLVLAQYLLNHDIPFRIFDRDSAIDARSGGWGLTLHWSLPALRELLPKQLVDRFPETFVNKKAWARGDNGRFQFFDLKSGVSLYDTPAVERIRVSRVRLRELLTTGIDVEVSRDSLEVIKLDPSGRACLLMGLTK